jgi:anti-anti-sigma factor
VSELLIVSKRRDLTEPDQLIVTVAGEIDLDTAPVLRDALCDAVEWNPTVCCDLSGVTFFSAAGVSALLAAYHRAASAGTRLTVRGAHGITERVLRISGLAGFLASPP